jgi:transcriptional regulator with XRE-family HTH domain
VLRTARQPLKYPALRRLGNRIRKIREQQGLSQEALADAAKINLIAGITFGFVVLDQRGISRETLSDDHAVHV